MLLALPFRIKSSSEVKLQGFLNFHFMYWCFVLLSIVYGCWKFNETKQLMWSHKHCAHRHRRASSKSGKQSPFSYYLNLKAHTLCISGFITLINSIFLSIRPLNNRSCLWGVWGKVLGIIRWPFMLLFTDVAT